jgi:hypothetical protein
VRIDRLVIADGDRHFTLPLHPRLTVVAGVGQLEREALASELIGSLGRGRPQVHLEMTDDAGRRLALYRPSRGATRVIDVETATDASPEFRGDDGAVNLWSTYGIDQRRGSRLLRLTASEIANASHSDAVVKHLASLDQAELWSLATAVRVTDEQLQLHAEDGAVPTDAKLIELVERRHSELDRATAEARDTLRHLQTIAVLGMVLALVALLVRPMVAAPGALVALLALAASMQVRRRSIRAQAAAQDALDEAGADSYLSFHLRRVSGILAEDETRRRLLELARDAREAAARWAALVGDVSLDWALEHQEEIRAAAGIRSELQRLETLSGAATTVAQERTTDLAHALVARLATLRHLGADGESFPLVLDEPFTGITTAMKPALLELLLRSAGAPQLVFLTDDDEIASWARVEMLTGELTVLEPRATPIHA